jgi:hypothetical protein
MPQIKGEVIVNRPAEAVFDFVADERNEPRFNTHMRIVEKTTEGPIGVGTRFRAEIVSMGRPMEMLIEFTEYDRPRLLGSVTHMAAMDTSGHLTFETAASGTRMSWSWDVQPRGILRLFSPLVAIVGRRQEQEIWTNLKRLLEAA